jgi:Calx-beta domain/Bacterial Ig-like domain (group 2)
MKRFTKCFLGLIGSAACYPISPLADWAVPNNTNTSLNNDTFLGKLGTPRAARDGQVYSDSYVQFLSQTLAVNEGDGSAAVAVQRTCSDKQLPSATASYQVITTDFGSTATPNVDYGEAYGTLKWGENECGIKEFHVPLNDDLTPEFNENFRVSISDVQGATFPTVEYSGQFYTQNNPMDITIVDNDAERAAKRNELSFSEQNYWVSENGSKYIEVNRGKCEPHSPEVSVDLVFTPETQEDYKIPEWYYYDRITKNNNVVSLHWDEAHSEYDCTPKLIYIWGNPDTLQELTETLTITLANPSNGATLETIPSRIVNILDDDSSTIGFAQANYEVEKEGQIPVVVERKNCTRDMPSATVEVFKDWYQETGKILAWQENECGSKSLELPEGNYSLGIISGATLNQLNTSVHVIHKDSETLTGFTQQNYNVLESNPSAIAYIQRMECDQNTPSTDVNYATYSGSATADLTWDSSFLGDFTIQSGSLHWEIDECDTQHFSVPIRQDATSEQNETIYLSLPTMVNTRTNYARSTATLTIIDDDLATEEEISHPEPIAVTIPLNTSDALNLSNAKAPLTWSVSDNGIIRVDEAGNITALALGQTTVTMTDARQRIFTWQVTVIEKDFAVLSFQVNSIVMGDYLDIKLETRPAIPDHNQQVDLWVGVRTTDMPEDQLLYMTDSTHLSELFSAIPQPFKRGLNHIDNIYPLLHFVITQEMAGEYTLYAVLTEAGKTPFEEGVQRSAVATQQIKLKTE